MAATTTADYLDPQTLAAIGSIELRARMIVEGLMTGMHRSPYQGFSVEFAQHRQYAPGDDTRFLDWKVYGKTDKLYLKQFQKETNLDLLVLVDVSGSMAFAGTGARPGSGGGWRKYDHAASLAAAMALLALRQQDRVGLVLFSDQVQSATRLSNARDHWRSIVDILGSARLSEQRDAAAASEIDPDPTAGQTDLSRLFDQVTARLARRSLLVLISDLFDDPAAVERGFARIHHRRHDLILLQTLDPAELVFPFRARAEFVGLEAEGRLPVDPVALRHYYLAALNDHQQQIEQLARRFQFDYLMLDTSQPIGPPLSHFMAKRSAGISKGSARWRTGRG